MVNPKGKIVNPKALTPKERGCIIKQLYKTRAEAKQAAKIKRGFGDDSYIYKCLFCPYWYLASQKRIGH